jgi:ribosome-associated translation inhibitor RaiA
MKLNKKLMLLIVLVMMSLNAFSQNDTLKVKDSRKIQLTKPIAKLVIKDLLKGDGLSTEIKTMQLLLTETNNKFLSQSDLVFNLKTQITNFESVNKQLNFKFEAQERLSKELETSLRRQKNKTKLYKIGTYIGVAAVGILIVK